MHLWNTSESWSQSSGHLLSFSSLPMELLEQLCLRVEEQNWGT